MDRDAFIAAVIADLSAPDAPAAAKSAQRLAEEAWEELQFDLPHLSPAQSGAFRSFLLDLCNGSQACPAWLPMVPAAAARLQPVVDAAGSAAAQAEAKSTDDAAPTEVCKQQCLSSVHCSQPSDSFVQCTIGDVAHIQHLMCCALPPIAAVHSREQLWTAAIHVSAACLSQLPPQAWQQGAAQMHLRGIALAPPPQATHLAGTMASFLRTSSALPTSTSCALFHALARSCSKHTPHAGGAAEPPLQSSTPHSPGETDHPWGTQLQQALWTAEIIQLLLRQSHSSATRNTAAASCFAAVGGLLATALDGLTWSSAADAHVATTLLAPWVAFLPCLASIEGEAAPAAADEPPAEDAEWGGFLAESTAARGTVNTRSIQQGPQDTFPPEWQVLFRSAVAGVSQLLSSVPTSVPWAEAADAVLLLQRLGLHGPVQARFMRSGFASVLEGALLSAAGGGVTPSTAAAGGLSVAIIRLLHSCSRSGTVHFDALCDAADAIAASIPDGGTPDGLPQHAAIHTLLKTLHAAAVLLQEATRLLAGAVSSSALLAGGAPGDEAARTLQARVTGIAAAWRHRGPILAAACKEQLAATEQGTAASTSGPTGQADSDSDLQDEQQQHSPGGGAASGSGAIEPAVPPSTGSDTKCEQRERLVIQQTLEMVAVVSGAVGGAHRATKALASAVSGGGLWGTRGGNKAD